MSFHWISLKSKMFMHIFIIRTYCPFWYLHTRIHMYVCTLGCMHAYEIVNIYVYNFLFVNRFIRSYGWSLRLVDNPGMGLTIYPKDRIQSRHLSFIIIFGFHCWDEKALSLFYCKTWYLLVPWSRDSCRTGWNMDFNGIAMDVGRWHFIRFFFRGIYILL